MPASFHLFCAFRNANRTFPNSIFAIKTATRDNLLISFSWHYHLTPSCMHHYVTERLVLSLWFQAYQVIWNIIILTVMVVTSGANVSNDCKSTKGSKNCREISFSQKMLNIEIPAFLQRNVNVWKVYYLRSESVFIVIHEQIFPKSFIWHMLSLKQ